MSHVLLQDLTASQAVVVDLRRHTGAASSTVIGSDYYRAIKLGIRLNANTGTALRAVVYPLVLDNGATPPAASTAIEPASGNANGTIVLHSTLNPEIEVGQSYSQGYSSGVFVEAVATHLLVVNKIAAAGQLVVTVD